MSCHPQGRGWGGLCFESGQAFGFLGRLGGAGDMCKILSPAGFQGGQLLLGPQGSCAHPCCVEGPGLER